MSGFQPFLAQNPTQSPSSLSFTGWGYSQDPETSTSRGTETAAASCSQTRWHSAHILCGSYSRFPTQAPASWRTLLPPDTMLQLWQSCKSAVLSHLAGLISWCYILALCVCCLCVPNSLWSPYQWDWRRLTLYVLLQSANVGVGTKRSQRPPHPNRSAAVAGIRQRWVLWTLPAARHLQLSLHVYFSSPQAATPSASRWDETPGRQKGSETPGVTPHRATGSETPGATPSARMWDATPSHVTPGHTTPGHATPGATTPGTSCSVHLLSGQPSFSKLIWIQCAKWPFFVWFSFTHSRAFFSSAESLGWNSQDRQGSVISDSRLRLAYD